MQPTQPQDIERKNAILILIAVLALIVVGAIFAGFQYTQLKQAEAKGQRDALVTRESLIKENQPNLFPGSSSFRAMEMIGPPDYKTYREVMDIWHYKVPDGEFLVTVMDSQVMEAKFVKSLPTQPQPDTTHPLAENR
jgi:hypothetical protein